MRNEKHYAIGIDCAVDPRKNGLALGAIDGPRVVVQDVTQGCDRRGLESALMNWIETYTPSLLALDAPLGWPRALGSSLAGHAAGASLPVEMNKMFSRDTDRLVWETIGKRPLEVGADRIARTAHAALATLDGLRASGRDIPLAWQQATPSKLSAIEVYPAATLLSRSLSLKGYKRKTALDERSALADSLQGEIDFGGCLPAALESPDAFDAVICLLAAQDFVMGRCMPPEDVETARKEGWIWFKPPP